MASCEGFHLHLPGVDPEVRRQLCSRPAITGIGLTVGDYESLLPTSAENLVRITRIQRDLSVLLVWADNDWVFRPEDRQAEVAHWQDHCPCRVTSRTMAGSGHDIQVHERETQFTRTVVRWLRARGL